MASWEAHTDTIFALAYDAARRRIISGARDSQVPLCFSLYLTGWALQRLYMSKRPCAEAL